MNKAKITKTFEFTHTLRKTRVADCQYKTEELDLNILACVKYNGGPVHDEESYSVEAIESVIYDGKNVYVLMYMLGLLEELETEAIAEAMELFTSKSHAA